MIIVGAGAERCKAVSLDGKKAGDMNIGHNKTLLCVDIKQQDPFYAVFAGEEQEVQFYKGMPFKHEKSFSKVHTGFVNSCGFTPDGNHFITVSQDKSVKMYNCESKELVIEKPAVHSMGINGFVFSAGNLIYTCSSDRSIKLHEYNIEGKTLEEKSQLNLNQFDIEGYKENVDKQQLGVLMAKEDILGCSFNSDINVWSSGDWKHTIRGHKNTVMKMCLFNSLLVSADNDGRILLWNNDSVASRPVGLIKHPIGVNSLSSNSKFVYSQSNDCNFMQWEMNGDGLLESKAEFVKKHANIKKLHADDESVYALYNDGVVELMNPEDLSVLASQTKDKMISDPKFEIEAFAKCEGEIWVGSSNGFVYILDDKTLLPKEGAVELKTNNGYPITTMSASPDKKSIAVGDSKGYITFFDVAAKAQKGYSCHHKNRIVQVHIGSDNDTVWSLGFDALLNKGSISAPKTSLKLQSKFER